MTIEATSLEEATTKAGEANAVAFGHNVRIVEQKAPIRQLATCMCGQQFSRLEDGRCPHCHLRILGKLEHMPTFDLLLLSEFERVGKLDNDKVVTLFMHDASKTGSERYGWHNWPQNLTSRQIRILEALEHLSSLELGLVDKF
jgi:hypothetical protein